MKYAAVAFLLAAQAETTQDNSLTDVAHVMEGLIMGALDAEFTDLEHCIQDAEKTITDVESAYNHLKAKDVKDVIEGLKDIGAAVMDIKNAVSDCKGIAGDFEKLAVVAVEFSNPETAVIHIGKDLIIHGIDIYHEVKASINAFEESPRNWYGFGFNIGKAAAQILIGMEEEEKNFKETTDVAIAKAVEENMFLY